jgi:hypothetical protein
MLKGADSCMGTPNAHSAASAEQPYYVWEAPGKAAVRLYFDVIDRMLPEIMRGFGALPRRGAEVGGLLLGRVLESAPLLVSVEEFEPVPCEYLSGPSYRLSASDRERLEQTLALWQDRPLRVVGFYRSHTRKDLFLDPEDADLFRRYFAGPEHVFLLVKPFATRASVAGFFFWEDGRMEMEAPYAQFPFSRRELGGGVAHPPLPSRPPEPPAPNPTPPRARTQPIPMPQAGEMRRAARPEPFAEDLEDRYVPALEKAETIPAELPPPADSGPADGSYELPPPPERVEAPGRPPARRGRWIAAAALLLGAAFAGYRYWPQMDASGGRAPAEALRLAVSVAGTQLDITWDRESPAILRAQRGVLVITDGAHRERVPLSAQQLREGRVLYTRVTREVALRLEVTADDGPPASESTRVLIAEPGNAAAAPPPPPAAARAPPPAAPKETSPVREQEAEPETASAAPPPESAAAPERQAARPARAGRTARRQAARPPAPVVSSVSEAPPPPEPAAATEPAPAPAEAPREVARPPRRR